MFFVYFIELSGHYSCDKKAEDYVVLAMKRAEVEKFSLFQQRKFRNEVKRAFLSSIHATTGKASLQMKHQIK